MVISIGFILLYLSISNCIGAPVAGRGGFHLRGTYQRSIMHRHMNHVWELAPRDEYTLLSNVKLPSNRRVQVDVENGLQTEYVSECTSFLSTSPGVADDGIISQNDFVLFLLDQCRSQGLCNAKTKLKFEQLEFVLQLKFIRGVCPYKVLEERYNCINDLNQQWQNGNEFGFRVDDANAEEFVKGMCLETYSDVVEMGFTRILGECCMLCVVQLSFVFTVC